MKIFDKDGTLVNKDAVKALRSIEKTTRTLCEKMLRQGMTRSESKALANELQTGINIAVCLANLHNQVVKSD